MKLTQLANFIIILQAAFARISFYQKTTNINCKHRKAAKNSFLQKKNFSSNVDQIDTLYSGESAVFELELFLKLRIRQADPKEAKNWLATFRGFRDEEDRSGLERKKDSGLPSSFQSYVIKSESEFCDIVILKIKFDESQWSGIVGTAVFTKLTTGCVTELGHFLTTLSFESHF